jgi:hypothetical protein
VAEEKVIKLADDIEAHFAAKAGALVLVHGLPPCLSATLRTSVGRGSHAAVELYAQSRRYRPTQTIAARERAYATDGASNLDYRRDGADRQRTITLSPDKFIRRFLLHVLPKGFHRIRHYGLLASGRRKINVALARELLAVPPPVEAEEPDPPPQPRPPCPCCGGRMVVIEIVLGAAQARAPPPACTTSGMTLS